MYGSEGLQEMRRSLGGRRVVWLYGSEGLLEMRGLEGEGCLVALVKGIT